MTLINWFRVYINKIIKNIVITIDIIDGLLNWKIWNIKSHNILQILYVNIVELDRLVEGYCRLIYFALYESAIVAIADWLL